MSRLSENPDGTVLLVKRGPAIDSWISRVPLLSSKFSDQKAPVYQSAPLPAVGGKTLTLVTGKALGCSTKIYSRFVLGRVQCLGTRIGVGNMLNLTSKKVKNHCRIPNLHSEDTRVSCLRRPYARLLHDFQGPWQNQSVKKEHFKSVATQVHVLHFHRQ